MPIQGIAAALVSAISLIITLSLLIIALRHEKKRPQDDQDEH